VTKICAATVVLALASLHAQPAETIRLMGVDGWPLAASFVRHPHRAPAVLLLPQCDATRLIFAPLLAALRRDGLHALTVDYAGMGESATRSDTGGVATRVERNRDLLAVYDWLVAQANVSRVPVVLGASCGGRQALDLARVRPQIRSIVLLGASFDADHVEWLRESSRVAVFAVTAEGDRADIAQRAVAAGTAGSELLLLPGEAHAANLFTPYPDLPSRISRWIQGRAQ
jgi:alpha/beta superfamily hydrolase